MDVGANTHDPSQPPALETEASVGDLKLIAKLLGAIRRDLDTVVRPDAVSPAAQSALVMASDMLGYLGVWLDELRNAVPEFESIQSEIADQIDPGTAGDGLSEKKVLPVETPFAEEAHAAVLNRLDGALAKLPSAGNSVLRPLMAAEVGFRDLEAKLVDDQLEREINLLQASEVRPNEAAMDAIATDYLGGGTTTDLAKLPGGFSKDTYRFTHKRPCGRDEPLVLRRDLPFNHAGTTVLREYKFIAAAHKAGIPVAEPVVCVAETDYVGQPFIILRFLRGASGTEAWENDPNKCKTVCTQLAHTLGRIHKLEPESLGFDPLGDPGEQIIKYITDWRDHWIRYRMHPSPTLMAGFQWLLEHAPVNLERATIVHGDIGFHNIMTDDATLVGLLDWEFAHLGDPAEDLAYCRQFVEPLMPWDDFMSVYRSIVDTDYSPERARFYEVWRSVRNAVSCSVAWHGFLTGKYPALKMAYQGVPLYRRFVRDTAAKIESELV